MKVKLTSKTKLNSNGLRVYLKGMQGISFLEEGHPDHNNWVNFIIDLPGANEGIVENLLTPWGNFEII